MQKQPLDYRSPDVRRQRPSIIAAGIIGAVVLIVNAILLAAAASDRSWGALQIGFAIGPLANLSTMGVALLAMIPIKRLSPTTDFLAYGIASILLPVLAVPADFLIIMSMGLHGC